MTERQPCCQAHHDHLSRMETALVDAEAKRQPPATITDADYLDAMRDVRLARQAIASHERWHARTTKAKAKREATSQRLATAQTAIREREARLNSYALADALASFAEPEAVQLIDEPDRIAPAVIVGAIYDQFADTGHWPTMDATAHVVADEMGATYSAARQAVADHVQGAYTAAQTCVLSRHGEALSEGPDDRWRLVVRDRDVRRLAVRHELDQWFDQQVANWSSELEGSFGR